MLEKQSTNVVPYSEDFTNAAWVTDGLTVSSNSAVSPDGTQNADKLVSNNASGNKFIYQVDTVASGTAYTLSAYFKSSEYTYAYFRIGGVTGNPYVIYNLTNQSLVSTSGSVTHSIQSFGNGWYRINLTVTTTSTVVAPVFSFLPTTGYTIDANNLPQYTGNGVNGGFIWGAQIEASAYPTSYIPTTSTSVTRLADTCYKTGISSLIGQTEGTIYAEIKVTKLLGADSRYIFHLSDGTANNRIYIAFSGANSNVLRARIFSGGTLQCSINSSALTSTGTYKLAMAYKNNDIVFYINGIQIGTDTSATIPTCSKVDLGHNQAGAAQFNDGINNANIWKTRLTNTELEQLTTI